MRAQTPPAKPASLASAGGAGGAVASTGGGRSAASGAGPARLEGATWRAKLASWVAAWRAQPVLSYYLILVPTALLVMIGTIIVFSALTIKALDEGGNPFLEFRRNALILACSVILLIAAMSFKRRFYFRFASVFLVLSWVLQCGIFSPLAAGAYGNTNWVLIPGINMTLQPSEFMKLALAVYLGYILSDGANLSLRRGDWYFKVGAPVLISLGLVMAGRDLGTAMVIAAMVFISLFLAGMDLKELALILGAGLFAVTVLVLTSENRRKRILGHFAGHEADAAGTGYQAKHGLWGLATGGLTGVGPGASREKWSYLPEASTDYIFAILGEEIGFVGTISVLILYLVLAIGLVRVIGRNQDSFSRIVTGGILGWIFIQITINIGAVVGLLPIIGVPLPLLSSGGSAMMATLLALGVVLRFARDEPGAANALGARSISLKKTCAILSPKRRRK